LASSEVVPSRANSLGALVRAHRELALLSQEQLAELAQLGVRTIRDLELGRVQAPHPRSVRQLAEALKLEGESLAKFEAAARRERWARRTTVAPTVMGVGSVVPAQLAADIPDFIGREAAIEQVDTFLLKADEPRRVRNAAVVSVISGGAGVGKSALALHLGHRLRSAFPDGQLWVNLRSGDQRPRKPAEVLERFLRDLGVDGSRIPADTDERAVLLRERLASRRILMILDNAADEAQVRPLIPGTSTCRVLITTRARLVALEAAQHIDLEVFTHDQAIELLTRIVGAERIAVEPDAARQLVEYCGDMPLAIRIVGARLAGHPYWSLGRLAGALGDEHRRLDEFAAADLAIRASIGLSYWVLPDELRRAFQLLSLLDAADFALWTASAVLGCSIREAERLVESLADQHLMEVHGTDPLGFTRYGFHDLLRLYARERAHAEQGERSRQRAITRGLGAWLALAEIADAALPSTSDVLARGDAPRVAPEQTVRDQVASQPLHWFEHEKANLASAVEQACELGLDELGWELSSNLVAFCTLRSHWDLWRGSHELALATSRWAGDRRAEASMLAGLGKLKIDLHQAHLGNDELEQAIRIFQDLGDCRAEARALHEFASALTLTGEFRKAAVQAERAAVLASRSSYPSGRADSLLVLGQCRLRMGQLAEAEAALQEAVTLFRQLGKPRGAAQSLHQLAALRIADGRTEDALELLNRCLEIVVGLGDRRGQVRILLELGELQLQRDDTDPAEPINAALVICQELGERSFQAQALHTLGRVHLRRGRVEDAVASLELASQLWSDLGDAQWQARTLQTLSEAASALADPSDDLWADSQRSELDGPRDDSS
jgi:tetratricopeptide (TPR) repeat protein